MQLIIPDISALKETAHEILRFSGDKKILLFYGEMGAGKTTLIKLLCEALGVTDNTSSPTFSIMNEYKTRSGNNIYHFDLYRLKKSAEAIDMGIEEYLYSGNYCFIEWPEIAEALYPENCVSVRISIENEKRIISLS